MDEAQYRVVERQRRNAVRVVHHIDPGDVPPTGGDGLRIVHLKFRSNDPLTHVDPLDPLPVRSGGMPRTIDLEGTIAALLIDLEEGCTRIAGVQLHAPVLDLLGPVGGLVFGVEAPRHAHPKFSDPGPTGGMVVGLGDDHVATIASSTIKVTTACGTCLDRGNHFKELVADGQQGVLQTEHADTRIDVTRFDSENR